MVIATLLALSAAVLHAAWNLTIKQTRIDRLSALWAQFMLAGVIAAVLLAALGGVPLPAWPFAVISACAHLPYVLLLAHAYERSDFSLAYPVARGLGAFGAAVGGVVLLGDHLQPVSWIGLVIVAAGLALLAWTASGSSIGAAAALGVVIAVYTVADARGSRVADERYALATFSAAAVVLGTWALVTRRARPMVAAVRGHGRIVVFTAIATMTTYGMVLLAFRRAPVGYVAALRESSVVIAALVGWHRLGERAGARRLLAACTVATGLIVLIAGR